MLAAPFAGHRYWSVVVGHPRFHAPGYLPQYPRCFRHFWYCSSLTFSNHSTFLPFTTFVIAMWLMALVGVAPCQCLTPAGDQITSPGLVSRLAAPSSCTHPVPEVTINSWPAGCVCQTERAPGANVTKQPVDGMPSFAPNRGSRKTDPVKYSAGAAPVGREP